MTPLWLATPLILLTAASFGLLAYWCVATVKIVRTLGILPTAATGAALDPGEANARRVCVIVPAHNEEGTLGLLLESLRRQDHPNMRVVVALDRCTDGTEAEARAVIDGDDRFEIMAIDSCPDDWAGKVNAVRIATEQSAGARDADYLLFTDADCWFEPACVRSSVALAEQRGLEMLSLLCRLTTDRLFEKVVQPAAGLEMARQYPLLRASLADPARRRGFANGQFILFRADAYRRIGGHSSVKDHLLEDLALGKLAKREGLRAAAYLPGDMVHCRMYTAYADFRVGWKRIYLECANRKARRLRGYAHRARLVGTALPLAAAAAFVLSFGVAQGDTVLLVASRGGSIAALAMWFVGLVLVYRVSRAPVWAAPLHPLASWLIAGILDEAASDLERRRAVEWGGRAYVLEGR